MSIRFFSAITPPPRLDYSGFSLGEVINDDPLFKIHCSFYGQLDRLSFFFQYSHLFHRVHHSRLFYGDRHLAGILIEGEVHTVFIEILGRHDSELQELLVDHQPDLRRAPQVPGCAAVKLQCLRADRQDAFLYFFFQLDHFESVQ